jgi:2-oxoglutarate ferredoxin oxidoreductase subunit gamma
MSRDGVLFVNSSIIKKRKRPDNARLIKVKATDEAVGLGNPKIANMIMLGSVVKNTKIVKSKSVRESLKDLLSGRGEDIITLNLSAFKKGISTAK